MCNAELARYRRFLQKYVFAGWGPPDDLKDWVRMFERMVRNAHLGQHDDADGTVPRNANNASGMTRRAVSDTHTHEVSVPSDDDIDAAYMCDVCFMQKQ